MKENLCYGEEHCGIPDFQILSCQGCPSYIDKDIGENKEQPEWTGRQWDKVQQLQAEIEYYRRERADLLLKVAKEKPKRKSRYD